MMQDRIRAGVFRSDINIECAVSMREIDWWFDNFNVGGTMRPREVFEMLAAGTAGTHSFTLSSIDVEKDVATLKIDGMARLQAAYFAQRSVEFRDGLVHQNFLKIEAQYQGQGIGRTLARNCYKLARRLNLHRLGVSAVDTGSYVWARAGFLPCPDSWAAHNCLGKILIALEEIPELDWRLRNDIYSRLDPQKPERLWFVSDLREPVVSKYDGNQITTLGKRLLIESGATWHGFLEFFDAAGGQPPGMRRAVDYLNL